MSRGAEHRRFALALARRDGCGRGTSFSCRFAVSSAGAIVRFAAEFGDFSTGHSYCNWGDSP